MKITPAWKDAEGKGLKDLGWALQYEGSIESEEEIEIEIGSRWLKLSGSLKSQRFITAGEGIEAGGGIKAGEGIEAGWFITAGRGIKAGCGIEAGCGITAGRGIEAGCGITAGLSIRCKKVIKWSFDLFAGTAVWKKPTDEECMIEAGELQGGEVKYGIVKLLHKEEKK